MLLLTAVVTIAMASNSTDSLFCNNGSERLELGLSGGRRHRALCAGRMFTCFSQLLETPHFSICAPHLQGHSSTSANLSLNVSLSPDTDVCYCTRIM